MATTGADEGYPINRAFLCFFFPLKDLVVALSIFVHVYGDPTVLCVALNQLKEGLFERFLMEASSRFGMRSTTVGLR